MMGNRKVPKVNQRKAKVDYISELGTEIKKGEVYQNIERHQRKALRYAAMDTIPKSVLEPDTYLVKVYKIIEYVEGLECVKGFYEKLELVESPVRELERELYKVYEKGVNEDKFTPKDFLTSPKHKLLLNRSSAIVTILHSLYDLDITHRYYDTVDDYARAILHDPINEGFEEVDLTNLDDRWEQQNARAVKDWEDRKQKILDKLYKALIKSPKKKVKNK